MDRSEETFSIHIEAQSVLAVRALTELFALTGHDRICSIFHRGDLEAFLVLKAQDVMLRFQEGIRAGQIVDEVERLLAAHRARYAQLRCIGGYDFDPVHFRLYGEDGTAVILTDKESDILIYLHDKAPASVGREELLAEVWGYAENVETHTIETHIYRLRQKIEADPASPKIVITDEKGYRLAT